MPLNLKSALKFRFFGRFHQSIVIVWGNPLPVRADGGSLGFLLLVVYSLIAGIDGGFPGGPGFNHFFEFLWFLGRKVFGFTGVGGEVVEFPFF